MKKIESLSAILYDLGISSHQIDNPASGFSYLKDGPLGLSFDNSRPYAAAQLIEELSEQQLTELLRTYGQEPRARSLAKAIKNSPGKIETTGQLASIIRKISGDRFFIKTASRIFQALRISVNDELGNIRKSIDSILPLLKPGGRAIVISYHSLEDGLIKQLFRKYSGRCICTGKIIQCQCGAQKLMKLVTAKPIQPDVDEVAANPRARSAKMRVVERIAV
jgi:16S rRNA (cytosine1402-N4)-methyltransferase